jgi:hypothetical protein
VGQYALRCDVHGESFVCRRARACVVGTRRNLRRVLRACYGGRQQRERRL